MRYVQYHGPSDTIDMSNVLGKPGMVFHTPGNEAVALDQRGNVIQVTNDMFEELQTFPRHRFVEVEEKAAKELVEKQSKARDIREQQAALFTPAEDAVAVAVPSVAQQIAAIPEPAVVAPAAPASKAEIKAETRAAVDAAAVKE